MVLQPPAPAIARSALAVPRRVIRRMPQTRRRTATSVVGGAFDEIATPAVEMFKYSAVAPAKIMDPALQSYNVPTGVDNVMSDAPDDEVSHIYGDQSGSIGGQPPRFSSPLTA